MRDQDGMYPAHPAHMKDYDALAKDWSDSERKYAQQVADLQAKNHALENEVLQDNAALRRQAQEIVERGKQNFALQAEVARLRTALLAWKIECAAFSLHDGESQIERTRTARIESRINGILEVTQ